MARPNRVFYISNEFNFFDNDNKTIDQIKEIILKCLVTGFGPFSIVSVIVTDKVAAVDIGEPCKLYPGVKISISGTGVTDLDTWHEIQTVDGNTFTFNVDVPDGNYTNGISLSYPSLGWQLLDRDANRFYFKSGNSSSGPIKVLLEFRKSTNNNYSWLMVVRRIIDESVTIKDIRSYSPVDRDHYLYLYYENYDFNKNLFFCYGDDAFVCLGLSNIYNYTGYPYNADNVSLNHVIFGEIKKNKYNVGNFILNAASIVTNNVNTDYSYNYTYCGILFGPYKEEQHKSISLVLSEKNGYQTSFINTAYLDFSSLEYPASGMFYLRDYSNVKYTRTNNYSPIVIMGPSKEIVGTVPGIFYTLKKPFGKLTFNNCFLLKVKAEGFLKDRHVYNRVTSNSKDTAYFTTDHTYKASVLFDLTGPIR